MGLELTVAKGSSPDPSDLAWLIGVLWGPGAHVFSGVERPAGVGTAYVIAPARRWPRMLLPDEREAARAALRGGSGTRSLSAGRRRGALARVLRTDAAWRLVRDRVWVPGPDELRLVLADAFGEPVWIAAGLRVRAPFRKPMLQVLSRAGDVIAYAKIAWNGLTARNLRAEHEALGALDGGTPGARTPRVIAMLEHRGFPMLVLRPMPDGVRRYGAHDGPPPLHITREISDVLSTIRPPSSIVERTRERLDAVREAGTSTGWTSHVVAAASLVEAGVDTTGLIAGAWHGDWAPWNLGHDGHDVWVWDWEHWRSGVPVGLDVPHYLFQQRFIGQQAPLADAFDAARIGSEDALTSLGYGDDERRAVHAIHVLEVCLRYLEAEAFGVPPNPRFVSGALDALAAVQA